VDIGRFGTASPVWLRRFGVVGMWFGVGFGCLGGYVVEMACSAVQSVYPQSLPYPECRAEISFSLWGGRLCGGNGVFCCAECLPSVSSLS